MKRTRGLQEIYADDPNRADALLWDRRPEGQSRRGFLKSSGLALMGAILGAEIVFARQMPSGLIPAALQGLSDPIPGKDPGLTILNERPLNAETPAHLLDDIITPASRLFVRNNGIPPRQVDPAQWLLKIGGESVQAEKTFSLADLQRQFQTHTLQLTLECGGNGRAEFDPPAKGNQWTIGAVGCPRWTGIRLRDLLRSVGIKGDAQYVAYYGKDTHLSGDPDKVPISRGVPLSKAMEAETLVAWAINGEDLPLQNGYPLRLVVGGWPGSCSGKWLSRIVVRDRIHDGPKMGGQSYRVPCKPVAPGTEVKDEDMCIIESMPVKSLITYPRNGGMLRGSRRLQVRGKAWAGDSAVRNVQVSIDFGATWQFAQISSPANRLAWQAWEANLLFPQTGYYEIWARATDLAGRQQPMVLPGWNPKGYLNNACHRIAVKVV